MMLPYGDIQSNAHFDFRPMVLAGMYYVYIESDEAFHKPVFSWSHFKASLLYSA